MKTLNRTAGLKCALASVLLLSCAGLSAAPRHGGHTVVRAGQHRRHTTCDQLSGGHIFLCFQGSYVDVTSTLTTINGQTYVTLQGVQTAVNLNTNNNTVTNLQGGVIGYLGAAKPS